MRRQGRKLLVASVFLAASMCICLLAAAAQDRPASQNYDKLCRMCHGEDGSGNGPAAPVLDKHPGDFTDCAAMRSRKRNELIKIITDGGSAVGRSSQMPASRGRLSQEEIEALADYVSSHFCSQ